MSFQFIKERFLLCEGDDDKAFLETLLRTRAGLPDFQVCHAAECNGKAVGGRSGFEWSLSGLKPIKGFDAVKAFAIATDNDKETSFAEVQSALAANGHVAPSSLSETGDIHGKPVAVLMLPSSTEYGDLEYLCWPEVARVWPDAVQCVTDFLRCTGADKWTKKSSFNKAKARAAIVGSYENDPYKGIGHLFRMGVLSTSNSCFDGVANFFASFDRRVGIRP
jgi:hypothetical protein